MDINYKLNLLKLSLNASKLDLKNIQKQINEILKYKELRNYDYLNTLLYPEKPEDVKYLHKCHYGVQLLILKGHIHLQLIIMVDILVFLIHFF